MENKNMTEQQALKEMMVRYNELREKVLKANPGVSGNKIYEITKKIFNKSLGLKN